MNTMNSYFEPNGFYSHPHQTAGGMGMAAAAAAHHDQSAATAAYRGFPLSLGMTPYGNHHHLTHQSSAQSAAAAQRAAQDSPYDASITAACTKLYGDQAYGNNKDCAKTGGSVGNVTTSGNNGGGGGVGGVGVGVGQDTNGYKDVWNTGSNNVGVGNGGNNGSGLGVQNTSVPVRPSACTPDSRVGGGYLDTSGGSPVSRSGGGGGGNGGGNVGATSLGGVVGGGVSAGAWNTSQCSIGGAGGQAAASAAAAAGLHQASNHTFYPWMAIAGNVFFVKVCVCLIFECDRVVQQKIIAVCSFCRR